VLRGSGALDDSTLIGPAEDLFGVVVAHGRILRSAACLGYGLGLGDADGEGDGAGAGEPLTDGLAVGDGDGSGGQPVPPGVSSIVWSTPTTSTSFD
jgi:hypothetical protein